MTEPIQKAGNNSIYDLADELGYMPDPIDVMWKKLTGHWPKQSLMEDESWRVLSENESPEG